MASDYCSSAKFVETHTITLSKSTQANQQTGRQNMSSSVKRSGIPIPSFSTTDVCPPVDKAPPKEDTKQPRIASVTPANDVAANWKVASLMQLEVALQHWRHHRDSNKNPSMSLDDFYSLVRKLDWSQTQSEDTTNDNDNDKKEKGNAASLAHNTCNLTVGERLLHDLLCVAAHPSMKMPLYRIDAGKGQLEALPHTADQMRRALSSTLKLDKFWSEKVTAMISTHRSSKGQTGKKQQKNDNNTSKTKEAKIPTAAITKGMTIDERVRAKAKARQQYDLQLQEKLTEDPIAAHHNKDKMWTIQLADALWSHARSILQRQNFHLPNKLASNSLLNPRAKKRQKVTSRRCVMAFGNVIQAIAKSRLGEASAVQIAKALTELEQYSPKWIEVHHNQKRSGERGKPKSFKWCKNTTTVFITPDNYTSVRSQVTGQPLQKGSKIVLHRKKQETTATTSSESKSNASKPSGRGKPMLANAAPTDNNRKRRSPVLGKKLFDDFEGATEADAKRSKTSKDVTSKTDTPSTFSTHPVLTS